MEEINTYEIYEQRWNKGTTELLKGGELDLSECLGMNRMHIKGGKYLKTPLTKLILGNKPGLTELIHSHNQLIRLDLSNCPNLTYLNCHDNQLVSVDVSNCPNLKIFDCSYNQLTSIKFLEQLPNPEKLTWLSLANNNIEPTNLEFLRPFVNLCHLTLGNDKSSKMDIHNRFYGSLKPLRNMSELSTLEIDGTDIEEGLEYLPTINEFLSLSPNFPNKKVIKIQNELGRFKFSVWTWQLAHPEKMLIARPKLFTNEDSKEMWIEVLKNKLKEESQEASSSLIEGVSNQDNKVTELEEELKMEREEIKKFQAKSAEYSLKQVEEIKKRDQTIAELKKQITGGCLERRQIKEIIEEITSLKEETNNLITQIEVNPK